MSVIEEQKQEHTQLAAINEVIKTIASSLDLRQVFDTFTSQLRRLVAFDRAAVALIEGDEVKRFALSVDVESEFDSGIEIPLKGTAAEWIAANKKVYIATDLAEERRFRTDDILFREGMRSVIRTPLFSRGEVIGNFTLSSCQPNAFGEKEQQILEEIAPLLSVAIENGRFFEQTRARAKELEASEAKYRRLAEDINDGYMVTKGGKVVFANAKMAQILGYKPKELIGEDASKFTPPEFIPYAQKTGQRVEQDRRVRERLEGAFLNKDGDRVPVEMSLKVIDYGGEPALAVIVRDITERKKADEEHQRYTKRVEALHAIAATVSQTLDLEQMLDGVVEKVIEVMEVDAAMIYTVDEVARDIVLKAYKGLSDEFVASVGRIRAEEEEVERMMGWKEPTAAFDRLYNEPNLTKIREAGVKEGVQSSTTVGLWSKGVLLGSLTIHCRHPQECTEEDLELLQAIASQIAVGIENARLFAEMSHSAATDGLTGLYNHRYFQERLEGEVARVHRFAGECSVIMLDLDHFKIYNDLFGHVAGDEVLKRVGQVLRDYTRQVDIACRYGGEEFTVILPHTGSSEAYQAAERLRQAIEQALSQEVASTSANLTVSLGIASYPIDGLSREALVHSADFAMREAKQRGRNQTCLAFELVDAVLVEDDMERETVEHLEAASLNTIYALAAAVDARDHYTYGHSRNVSKHAVAIGKALGLSRRKLQRLRIAALLHDIGKIGLSDSMIRKPGPLDEAEWVMMRKHSALGATIISHTPELADCAPALRHHHEWQDGSGYPDGLKGEDIPLEARIIAVADAYDTMTTPRAYRETLSPQEALEELRRCANTQFDPQLVETFTRVANSGVRAPAELSPL
ncbi:MAG: diguanylate cyclase [Dehalococcoidia bacterium]|jgi:diguanylate cyclase (GGDEF)-like protein/PAS domain S-box-containing protein|nr:diguanylate cyclase [Chloroflexota bacterium]MCK4243051.1 diguanylate cyclase [Dehalococcoidia bacterium]